MITAGGFDVLLAHPCAFFDATPIGRFVSIPKVLYAQQPHRVAGRSDAPPDLARHRITPISISPPASRHYGKSLWSTASCTTRAFRGREELRNVAVFDRILVNSLFSRESILRTHGLDAEVCYPGTDALRFTHHGRRRENLVIGLGSFNPPKNIRLVIEAVAMLPPPRPTLAWIGNAVYGDYLDEMSALASARSLPFAPHIRIADDDIVALLNRAAGASCIRPAT